MSTLTRDDRGRCRARQHLARAALLVAAGCLLGACGGLSATRPQPGQIGSGGDAACSPSHRIIRGRCVSNNQASLNAGQVGTTIAARSTTTTTRVPVPPKNVYAGWWLSAGISGESETISS